MVTEEFLPDDLINSVVDNRFEVLAKLGEGGMGAIYKARQMSMDRPVALKILLRDRRGDTISAERFRHEAHLASRLRHPNVVVIYDHGQSEDGLLYIAMELLAGENLKERMGRVGPFELAAASRIIRQTLYPIDQAHKLGMIHRDLKPANIFLTNVQGDPDFVKVLDFGVAKLTAVHEGLAGYQGGLTVAGTVYGTPNYMSPEQIRGQEVGQPSDIYSLGIIFYEMLCGRRPYEAETPVDVMMMHLRDEPVPPSQVRAGLPPLVDDVIDRALAKEVVDRYASCEEFIQDVEAILLNLRGGLVSGEVRSLAGVSDFDGMSGRSGMRRSTPEEVGTIDMVDSVLPDNSEFDEDDLMDLDEEKTVLELADFGENDGSSIGLDEDDFELEELFEDSVDLSGSESFAGEFGPSRDVESLSNQLPVGFGREAPRRISGSSPVKQTFSGHPGSALDPVDVSTDQSIEADPFVERPAGIDERPTHPRRASGLESGGGLDASSAAALGLSGGVRLPDTGDGLSFGNESLSGARPVLPPPPAADSAFQLPAAAVASSRRPQGGGLRSLLVKAVIGCAALAVGAALVVFVSPLVRGGGEKRAKKLAVMSQPVGVEVYSNQMFIGNTPVEIDLSKEKEPASRALKLILGSETIDMTVNPGSGALWVYVDFERYNQSGRQGKAYLEAQGVERRLLLSGRFVGETPLLFLGEADQDHLFQVDQGEGKSAELMVKPSRSQVTFEVP